MTQIGQLLICIWMLFFFCKHKLIMSHIKTFIIRIFLIINVLCVFNQEENIALWRTVFALHLKSNICILHSTDFCTCSGRPYVSPCSGWCMPLRVGLHGIHCKPP